MTFWEILRLAGFILTVASLILAVKSVKLLTYNGMMALFLAAGDRELSGANIAKKLGYISVFSLPTLITLEREGILSSRWETGFPGRRRRLYRLTSAGRDTAETQLGLRPAERRANVPIC